jgi:hypothetical protein
MEDVCDLPNGFHLMRKSNEAGGHTYFSDEVGGGVMVWDTCLVGEDTLLAAIVEEKRRICLEYHVNQRLIGANKVWDLLVDERCALEENRSEFLLWFKTSLPFYPQHLMSAQKPVSTEYNFPDPLAVRCMFKLSFCVQMITAKLSYLADSKFDYEDIIFVNDKLKLISC